MESTKPHVLTGHIGTHLDTYNKSEIPLEYFKSTGIYIDVREIAEKREIEIKDIENISIPEKSFLIFHTGRADEYEYGNSQYFKDHPQFSNELMNYLVKQNINFIGIDCSGIRRGDEQKPADIIFEDNNIYIIENLCNLKSIKSNTFDVYTMWLEDEEMTGLPCRVLVDTK